MGTLGAGTAIQASYFIAAALFIFGLKRMSSPVTARSGIVWAGVGMVVGDADHVLDARHEQLRPHDGRHRHRRHRGLGHRSARRDDEHAADESPSTTAWAAARQVRSQPSSCSRARSTAFSVLTLGVLGGIIGAVSFSGSLIAFGKLQG
jgi:NAD(P) transhydrogenase subunit beta